MKSFYVRIEALVIGIVLAFPLLGTFMPIETYLRPNTSVLINAQQPTESFGFSHIVVLGVEALTVYLLVTHARGMLGGARRGLLLVALIVLVFASSAWAIDPDVTLKRALRFLVYAVFALYLFEKYEIGDFTRYMTRVLAVPVFASFAVLLISPKLGFSSYSGDPYAVRGAALDKNALGDLMGFVVLISGYSFFSRANSRMFSGSVLLGSLVLVAAAPSTTSRIVVLAMMVLALYAWVVRKRFSAAWGIMGALWTVMGMILISVVVVDFEDFLKLVGKSASLTGRTGVWHAVIETIRLKPLFGFGYAFWSKPSTARTNIWFELGWATPSAHNNWLDIMLQLGLVGLSIAVAIWLVALSRAIRLGFFTKEPGAIVMALIIANIFIRSWTESVMLEPADMFWMWFVLAYLYLARMSEARKTHSAAVVHAVPAYPSTQIPRVSVASSSRSNATS